MRWTLVVLIGAAAACGGKASSAAPVPATENAVRDTTVTLRIPQDSLLGRMTPDVAQKFQADLEASRRASMSAVSATVRMDTVRLKIGGQVPFYELGIVARDSSGNIIPGFGPSLRIEDRSIATLQGPNITGLTTGVTALIIGARTETPATNEVWMRDLARVTIIVGM